MEYFLSSFIQAGIQSNTVLSLSPVFKVTVKPPPNSARCRMKYLQLYMQKQLRPTKPKSTAFVNLKISFTDSYNAQYE